MPPMMTRTRYRKTNAITYNRRVPATANGGAVALSYSCGSRGSPAADATGRVPPALRFTWQGREYSRATALYNFRARWYDPASGRWLSKDPIGLEGGLNLYEAFGSNPVCFRDPEGCLTWSQVGYFVGGLFVGAAVTAAVIVAAPVVATVGAAVLTTLGVPAATATTVATAAVSAGLCVGGAVGFLYTSCTVIDDISSCNYDSLAFTLGSIVGGGIEASCSGRYLAESLTGHLSPSPNTFNPTILLKNEVANRYRPSLDPPGVPFWATGPTPLSGGTAATLVSSGVSDAVESVRIKNVSKPSIR